MAQKYIETLKRTTLIIVFIIYCTKTMAYKFPKGFMFGTSTAAYQVEGAWNENGKGENIWDHLVHTQPEAIMDRTNGDVACDSYHKYKEDIALIKNLKVKFYRFSISWARIAPTGETNSLNKEGIAFYNRFIDELIANDIVPIVTMYHWDLPHYLQKLGGWVNPIMSDYFKEYARVLFTYFGDRVKWWITINEPLEISKGYVINIFAPANLYLNNTGYYLVGHTLLLAHAKAYRLYEKKFKSKQQGKISMSLSGFFFLPKNSYSDDDIKTAERANQFEMGWFSHPIYKGDYPPIMRQWVDNKSKKECRPWSTLPTFTEDEIKLIKGTADFYAINHYTSRLVTYGSDPNPYYNPDAKYITSVDELWPKSPDSVWLYVVPDGLKQLLNWVKNEFGNPPMLITENGYGDGNEQLNDTDRINYLTGYLNAILQAIHKDRCNLIGYMVWSFLDSFEWIDGYKVHFGLVKVDFNDPQRSRTPRASYSFFKNVVSTNQLP